MIPLPIYFCERQELFQNAIKITKKHRQSMTKNQSRRMMKERFWIIKFIKTIT